MVVCYNIKRKLTPMRPQNSLFLQGKLLRGEGEREVGFQCVVVQILILPVSVYVNLNKFFNFCDSNFFHQEKEL